MSGSQKHSITYHFDNSTALQGSSLLVPVAKWTGGGGSTTGASTGTPHFSAGNSAYAAAPSSSALRGGLQSRSRNIDIPNSKPRLRPKHPSSSVSRVTSNVRSMSGKKSTFTSAAPLPAPVPATSDLNWHTRPPRGGLAALQPTSYNQAALKPRGKKPLSTRREEYSFAPVEAPRNGGGSVGWVGGFAACDEESFTSTRNSDHSRDTVVRAAAAPIRIDAVEGFARALLSDCIIKRNLDQIKVKKVIKIDVTSSPLQSSSSHSCTTSPTDLDTRGSMPLYEDGGGVLSCSSSDDELHQLYKLEPSFVWDDKCRVDGCLSKTCCDISHYRDADHITSSPESDSYISFEEKGLSKEIRYNLPIAYGTVNETEKHCTICQVAYEIGSHIVTLTPCQHFFHALCIDKWLCNHVTCPLCRKEVVYDLDKDTAHVRGIECPEEDQETMRRKLRSQCAEFRPVKPLKPGYMGAVDVGQLDAQFLAMQVQDERTQLLLDHLACPTPQRKY